MDLDIKECVIIYSKLYGGGSYNVRFTPNGDSWKADVINFTSANFHFSFSKESACGKSMQEAAKNLKEMLLKI